MFELILNLFHVYTEPITRPFASQDMLVSRTVPTMVKTEPIEQSERVTRDIDNCVDVLTTNNRVNRDNIPHVFRTCKGVG